MGDVVDIDCTGEPREAGHRVMDQLTRLLRPQQQCRPTCVVPLLLSMADVWNGSAHEVCVEDGRQRTSTIVHVPCGKTHGERMAVTGTVLILSFQRNDTEQRHDAHGRYSVRLNGDDVLYRVHVNALEQRAGFTRDLSVVVDADTRVRAHLRIKCTGERCLAGDRPLRFRGRGVAGGGSAYVHFLFDEGL